MRRVKMPSWCRHSESWRASARSMQSWSVPKTAPTELLIPKGRVPEAGMEYVRRLRDVKYNETIFEILARQFEVAKLDEAKEGAIIQVVDPAIPPDKRSFPKRSLIVIGATVFGFLFGILLALAQAGFERVKEDPDAAGKIALLKRALTVKRPSTA